MHNFFFSPILKLTLLCSASMSVVDQIVKFLDDHQYVFLTWSVLFMLLWTPFVVGTSAASFWIHFFLSLILLCWLFAASSHNKFVFTSVFLGIFTLVFSRVDFAFFDERVVALSYLITGLLFFLFVTSSLMNAIHEDQKIDKELIFGSIAWYLMIGFTWAFVYAIIELLIPGSFSISMDSFAKFPQFIYYSFVNLTTLWYGDIVPVLDHAQAWSVFFTIAGQMYLTILIGVVVGKYLRKKLHDKKDD